MGHELRMRIKTLVMILAMVVCANAGDLMLKRGMMQIGAGLLRDGSRTRVVHPVELLDRSYAVARPE